MGQPNVREEQNKGTKYGTDKLENGAIADTKCELVLTSDCGEYAVKTGIYAVSRMVYCAVTKYEGPGECSHVRPETA